jgi:muramoyltetrapeptide carboxypeptidase
MRPAPLQRGDVVCVVAPSGPVDPDAFERGLAVLRDGFGLAVRTRPDVGARRAYLAGDDARRAAEWREAVADREARAIFCARGGYGAMRILPEIDPAPLLERPRWFVGFSDATAVHAVLNRAGLVTVHGPTVQQLGALAPDALAHLRAVLFGDGAGGDPLRPGSGVAGSGVVRPGRATGPLLGGSLTLLAHLCGTPFLPPLAGAILFVEDVQEKPYRLDRYFTQLRLAGALAGVAGVAVGHLTCCDDAGVRGVDAMRELVGALGVPAIDGVPAGHERDNAALPLGAPATLVAPAAGEPGPPRLEFEAEPRAIPLRRAERESAA